jgi:sporulation protein YlmC with PRC-barrel domain
MASPDGKPVYLNRDEILGKSVVASNGLIVGTVADLVVSPEGKVGIRVTPKSQSSSQESVVGSEDIQAIGDVILLKAKGVERNIAVSSQVVPPPPNPVIQTRTCRRCGYLNGMNSRFCIKCGNSLQ